MLEVTPRDGTSQVSLSPADPATRLVLRGRPAIAEPAAAVFGVPLPQRAGTSVVVDTRAALWLGPDEWLLLAPVGEMPAVAAALVGVAHSVVDVSDRQLGLVLDGPGGETVLAAGCPLDLDSRAFPIGACTRTVCAKAEIVLWRTASYSFRIEVARSLAAYLTAFLAQAEADWLITPP